ncbi:MAG: hypothetical protein H0X69_17510, partial [Gemmatimonadales bacterium]|nr:hypothetical protein [Gemmatimonadales bacterium]
MDEQRGVPGGKEADRRRRLGGRERSAREVEQLPAALVAEAGQVQPLELRSAQRSGGEARTDLAHRRGHLLRAEALALHPHPPLAAGAANPDRERPVVAGGDEGELRERSSRHWRGSSARFRCPRVSVRSVGRAQVPRLLARLVQNGREALENPLRPE